MELNALRSEIERMKSDITDLKFSLHNKQQHLKTMEESLSLEYMKIIDIKVGDKFEIDTESIEIVGGRVERLRDSAITLRIVSEFRNYPVCEVLSGVVIRNDSRPTLIDGTSRETNDVIVNVVAETLGRYLYEYSEWGAIIDRHNTINQVIK